MTANQINAAKQREEARHNAYEEQLNLANIREQVRHNLRTEKEAKRHNMKVEATTTQANYETQRHNVANEDITKSYNLGNLFIGQQQADVAKRNAEVNAINAATNARGMDLAYAKAPYEMTESTSRTQLNRTTTEMKPYETGVRLVDSFVNAISSIKPRGRR